MNTSDSPPQPTPDQTNQLSITLQPPATKDKVAWNAYWLQMNRSWSWRTEPEIGEKRKNILQECRAIVPDIKKGSYPFKDVKLSRADVEWLLATHENGCGPVDWSDEQQRE